MLAPKSEKLKFAYLSIFVIKWKNFVHNEQNGGKKKELGHRLGDKNKKNMGPSYKAKKGD